MVRVFAAYHYRGQSVHPVNNDDDDDDDAADDAADAADSTITTDDGDYDGTCGRSSTANATEFADDDHYDNDVDDDDSIDDDDADGDSSSSAANGGGSGDATVVLASAIMDDDHLIVAKSNHCIEIVPLTGTTSTANNAAAAGSDGDVLSSANGQQQQPPSTATLTFPTLDRVHRLLYCKQGEYGLGFSILKHHNCMCRILYDPIPPCKLLHRQLHHHAGIVVRCTAAGVVDRRRWRPDAARSLSYLHELVDRRSGHRLLQHGDSGSGRRKGKRSLLDNEVPELPWHSSSPDRSPLETLWAPSKGKTFVLQFLVYICKVPHSQ